MARAFEDQLGVGPTLIGHEMVLSGDNVWNVLDSISGGRDQLSQELRAAQEPWDGFEALMYHGLGTRRRLEHEAAQFCVRAPLPVRFRPDHLRLSRGNLSFALETANPALLPYCTVGYVSTVHDAIGKRATVAPDHETRWASAEGSVTWACNQEVTDAERVAIFARVGPYVVDRTTVVDERLRVQRALVSAYETVDRELELLGGRLLKPQKSEQVEFERALARVLLFCGFAVDSFAGDSRLSDAIDIIAHAPTTNVLLAVECTTGPLQSRDGKLSRLVARTQAIANRLPPDDGSMSHTTVIPVIATSLEKVSISDMASARADGVRVLTHQALVELLEIARTGAGPDAVLALLREGSSDGRGRVSDIS